jgi:hypothetical protein
MDPEYFGPILPQTIRSGGGVPVDVLCGAFGVGQMLPGGYNGGIVLGEYALEKGKVILNNFRLLDGIGSNPAAECILLGLVKVYGIR